MKKKIIISVLVLAVISAFFIPVTEQKTVVINKPFLRILPQIINGENWTKWRPDIKHISLTDSSKILIKKDSGAFVMTYPDGKIEEQLTGDAFVINEDVNGKTNMYSYFILPAKNLNKTNVTVSQTVDLAKFLTTLYKPASFADTHIGDLKKFMETDSLLYGCAIVKTPVPGENLIVSTSTVLAKDQFATAGKLSQTLQQYVKVNGLQQICPLIAQFVRKHKDSTQVKVGLFINKSVTPTGGAIQFERMPKEGTLVTAKYTGKFANRQQVYNGIQQFFTDHFYQTAILPFDSYLDNKLPGNGNDIVNIRVNVASLF